MKASTVIGQVETVALPAIATAMVHARIDTGAKTSAVWVSHYSEDANGLHVTFFGPGFPAYTGEIVTFNEYAETVVASSNGIAEHRFKVKLQVTISGRVINAWFTLADRSKQTYPVLIGRNILRGKFLVDVSRRPNNLQKVQPSRSKVLKKATRKSAS
jgi:hypothetical protein